MKQTQRFIYFLTGSLDIIFGFTCAIFGYIHIKDGGLLFALGGTSVTVLSLICLDESTKP